MKKAKIFAALLVLLLAGSQAALGQTKSDVLDKDVEKNRRQKRLAVQKTEALMSTVVPSKRGEILQTGESDELFLVNVGKPSVSILKNEPNPQQTEFWYLVVSDNPVEKLVEEVTLTSADTELPVVFSLSQNYPNPFNPTTTIKFQLPAKNGTTTHRTVLKVYDILGRLVRTIVDEDMSPGFYAIHWDGLNDNGVGISSGVYFYSITSGEFRETKKMLLIK